MENLPMSPLVPKISNYRKQKSLFKPYLKMKATLAKPTLPFSINKKKTAANNDKTLPTII